MAHPLDLDNPDDRDTLNAMLEAKIEQLRQDPPWPRFEFATVTAHGHIPEQTFPESIVSLAGDPPDQQMPVTNVLPTIPEQGDRVLTLFAPPQGVFIVGSVKPRAGSCFMGNYVFDPVEAWGAADRQVLLDVDVNTRSLECGFRLIDGDASGDLNTLVVPAPGIYVASFGAVLASVVADDQYGGDLHLGDDVITHDAQIGSAAAVNVYLNGRAAAFYANAGDEIYLDGFAGTSVTASGDASGVTVWALCCDYVPGLVQDEPPPE